MVGLRKKLLIYGTAGILIVAVVIALLVVYVFQKGSEEAQTEPELKNDSILGRYKKAAVATNGEECAEIGAGMLAKDGSAVDAAIAALLCEGVASLHSMGLGGGFLMTIWDAKRQRADYLDARETAPAKAHRDMFEGDPDRAMFGGLAVAVPGELLGYWEAHQKYGKLPWSELFEPTIELCKVGSRVNSYLAAYLTQFEERIKAEETLAEILVNPATNSVWKTGDRIRRPKLAKTLVKIARYGPDIFYRGSMGDDLVKEIQAFDGVIEKKDLEDYRVKWREPIKSQVWDHTIYTAPPPGSGVILSFIMNILEDLLPSNNRNVMWQRMVETFKWAYARRTELGDPDTNSVDIGPILANLTDTAYAKEIRLLINDHETSNDPQTYGVVLDTPDDSGTSHVSVLAPDGSAVSVTSTVNQVLGAMIRSKSTGIIFNDEMDDFGSPNITNGFGLPPSPANFIEPGKRPLSSMAPTIIVNSRGEVRLVIGAAGGTKITTAIALSMVLNMAYDYNIKEAIDNPRIHHQLLPMVVQNEKGFDHEVLTFLSGLGHNVTTFSGIGSAIAAVARVKGEITANSDFRRQGSIAGY